MNVPPWAGFVADFPDDQVENGLDIEIYGGRNVARALCEIFASLGCSRISEPESEGDQGWAFDLYHEGRHRFWCRVQSFHPVFWLHFEDVSGTAKGASAYVDLWRRFGNALERDRRFHKILWRPFKEGPPDWDEVEAAADPPERTFDETFPPSEINPKKPPLGCGCLPVVIWIWFTLSGVSLLAVGLASPPGKERSEYIWEGVAMLVLCSVLPVGILVEYIRRRVSRSRSAHAEFWRKFAYALKPISRFNTILGRSSEEGSPDWDEFTITDDLPKPAIPKELPRLPAKPRPKAAGGPVAPIVIGAWCALAALLLALIEHTVQGAKAQTELKAMSIAGLLIGLAIVLRMTDRHRKRGLDSPGEDRDSDG